MFPRLKFITKNNCKREFELVIDMERESFKEGTLNILNQWLNINGLNTLVYCNFKMDLMIQSLYLNQRLYNGRK